MPAKFTNLGMKQPQKTKPSSISIKGIKQQNQRNNNNSNNDDDDDDERKNKMMSQEGPPSKNLNVAYPQFSTAKEMYAHLRQITAPGGEFVVRNFCGVIADISPSASLVETDLFPAGALHYYTKKNMGWEYTSEEYDTWQLPERGGEQGDYRDGMASKIANVIDCLKQEPWSKRAVVPIPYSIDGSATIDWKDPGQNKCCRELHFYIENGLLKCTGIVRMQNANIFVKNIHFFATLINHVADELGLKVGEYTHWITNLCHDRSASSC